jgi:hypothetical protein
MPQKEAEIHEGRKRIDILYVNSGASPFWHWLSEHYPAAHVIVECKNYGNDIANEELDQLAGRFSPSRGKIGLSLSRSFDNKDLFWKRCIDTAHDDREFIIPLDDEDLSEMVGLVKAKNGTAMFGFLKERFDRLVM